MAREWPLPTISIAFSASHAAIFKNQTRFDFLLPDSLPIRRGAIQGIMLLSRKQRQQAFKGVQHGGGQPKNFPNSRKELKEKKKSLTSM